MTPIRQRIQRKLRRVVVERRLTYADVAIRTGLVERTVERFLEGKTFSDDTADRIAAALRVDLQVETEDMQESPLEELLTGLPLWRLRGSAEWWARMADVAVWLKVDRSAPHKRVLRGLRGGELAAHDVRGGVRDGDTIGPPRPITLTSSRRGCTMLSARACLWLLLTSDSAAGDRSLDVVIGDLRLIQGGRR